MFFSAAVQMRLGLDLVPGAATCPLGVGRAMARALCAAALLLIPRGDAFLAASVVRNSVRDMVN